MFLRVCTLLPTEITVGTPACVPGLPCLRHTYADAVQPAAAEIPESGNRTGVTHVAPAVPVTKWFRMFCNRQKQNALATAEADGRTRDAAALPRQVEHAPRAEDCFPAACVMGSPRTAPRKAVELWNKRALNSSASI